MKPMRHRPVMLTEVLAALRPLEGKLIVDGTFGAGGYTSAFLAEGAHVIALDRDPDAIKLGQQLVERYAGRLQLFAGTFSHLSEIVCQTPDAIVLDIGVSSMQIDDAARGFSFQKDGPLDMRMSQSGKTAADIVNLLPYKDLSRLIYFLGEEHHARRIAKMICQHRETKPFSTTLELANSIASLIGRREQDRIHPATRTFQALRIFLNNELDELIDALFSAEMLLARDGRLAVVTFHSLEDRIVKRFFVDRSSAKRGSRHFPSHQAKEPSFSLAFKGVKTASSEEIEENPRARSAKLRVGIRTDAPPFKPDRKLFGLAELATFEGMD